MSIRPCISCSDLRMVKREVSTSSTSRRISGFPHHRILAFPEDFLLADLFEAQGQVQPAALGRGPQAHISPLACRPVEALLDQEPADTFPLVLRVDDQVAQIFLSSQGSAAVFCLSGDLGKKIAHVRTGTHSTTFPTARPQGPPQSSPPAAGPGCAACGAPPCRRRPRRRGQAPARPAPRCSMAGPCRQRPGRSTAPSRRPPPPGRPGRPPARAHRAPRIAREGAIRTRRRRQA